MEQLKEAIKRKELLPNFDCHSKQKRAYDLIVQNYKKLKSVNKRCEKMMMELVGFLEDALDGEPIPDWDSLVSVTNNVIMAPFVRTRKVHNILVEITKFDGVFVFESDENLPDILSPEEALRQMVSSALAE